MFWCPNGCCKSLAAYARSCADPGFGGIVSLDLWQCDKALLKTVCGLQMLVLRDTHRRVQVRCSGEDIRLEPFALEPIADHFPNVRGSIQAIELLANLFGPDRKPVKAPDWTVEATRHRDALMALDLRLTGRSYRQIAIAIYGENAVQNDWNNPNQTMKNRLIRSVKRGSQMMNGGYRKLLT